MSFSDGWNVSLLANHLILVGNSDNDPDPGFLRNSNLRDVDPGGGALTPQQWRRCVVKSEGLGSPRSSHQTKSRPKFVFVFGAENELFGHFRLFSFSI